MLARTPPCTITEKSPTGYTGSVFDTFNTTVKIEGETKEAVEQAMADYRKEHARCEPPVMFGYVFHRDGKFIVSGSRGDKSEAKVIEFPVPDLREAGAGGIK